MTAALAAPLARALGRGRHAATARHRAPTPDDFPIPLDVLDRIVRSTVAAALPPIPPQLAERAARWAQAPGGFDREVFG